MPQFLREVRWLPLVAVALVCVGFVLIIISKEYYQLATVVLLAAIVFAVLTGKDRPA